MNFLSINDAEIYNIREFSVEIPHDDLTVVTGPSGSGKSTFISEVIYGEWQRRVGRRSRKSVVRTITGLRPVLFFENRGRILSKRNVLTESGALWYLEFLLSRKGKPKCLDCGGDVLSFTTFEIIEKLKKYGSEFIRIASPMPARFADMREYLEFASKSGYTQAIKGGERIRIESLLEGGEFRDDVFGVAVDTISANQISRLEESLGQAMTLNPNIIAIFRDKGKTEFPLGSSCIRCGKSYSEIGIGKVNYDLFSEDLDLLLSSGIAGVKKNFQPETNNSLTGLELKSVEAFRNRLETLCSLGVGYLSLNRKIGTLSSGELQRVRLSRVLAERVKGAIFALDEPTAGLHPIDTGKISTVFRRLIQSGNTVIAVTHDLDIIRQAKMEVDLTHFAQVDNVLTINGRPADSKQVDREAGAIELRQVSIRVLQNISCSIPLGKITAVCGVSGSGKSTLIFDFLYPALEQALKKRISSVVTEFGTVELPVDLTLGLIWRIVVFQSSQSVKKRGSVLGRLGLLPEFKELYAKLELSRIRGLKAKDFQISDSAEDIKYRGLSFGDLKNLSITEAFRHFSKIPPIKKRLEIFLKVGLGYLILGQPASRLSYGEEQRVELSKRLRFGGGTNTIYLLDEPLRGLHQSEQGRLLGLFREMVDRGDTIVVIDHSPLLLREADKKIELSRQDEEQEFM